MTRMWMCNPKFLCTNHLLGEHKELHQELGSLKKERYKTVFGHVKKQQVDLEALHERHEQLVEEFKRREWPSGIKHQSSLTKEEVERYVINGGYPYSTGHVNVQKNIEDLKERCPKCRERIEKFR